ncbi:TetR/AcrR family transcriptional regulator [Galbitalea soli]|uniref:TetR/AcrR family transcriptional regulator n=1 Tax=Galbitalea soli TaxID=1268042 RepID=A0A7C9TPX9_9MICO|nr:TetR/AcrR family transcriptional regulator [Galbitalea soli]NEM90918.1 TetR/AcrR family transcriptional regulator [Galbitalea soli]NYJ29604.1 AcrR family transcriptional regulator [Galbitalea soli]
MTVTTDARPRPRDRVLDAAARLFIREGVHAVGVDRLAQEAQVSKRSIYQHFESKDAIVADMLRVYGPRVVAGYFSDDKEEHSPRERVLHVYDALHRAAEASDFYGCPFVNVATELRDREHPAAQVAQHFKSELTAYFERQAETAGAASPHVLAVQLTLLFDGASASAALCGGTPLAARLAAEQLWNAAITAGPGDDGS